MIRFKCTKDAHEWVEANAHGWCCVIVTNQRMLMSTYNRNDMRLLETEVNQAGVACIHETGIWI